VMVNALIDLHELTGGAEYLEKALALLASSSAAVSESPIATANSTRALLRLVAGFPERFGESQREHAPGDQRVIPGLNAPAVEVYASESRVEVGPDRPAELHVRIVIPHGWHINDAFAGEASAGTVTPLVLGIAGGTGVQPYAEFPHGDRAEGASHRVLTGEVVFPVVLERAGDWTGAPRLLLTYQACSDRACLEPRTVDLGVDIARDDATNG